MVRYALTQARVPNSRCLEAYLYMRDRQEAIETYKANTLWAVTKALLGRKYRIKPLIELLPPLAPERHDSRSGEEIMGSVLQTLQSMAKEVDA